MKIRLNNIDVLQIAKALKCGWLDTDKIDSFKSLVEGYNPPKGIKREELNYYLECLFKGWGYEPTNQKQVEDTMLQRLDSDLLEKWRRQIEDGSIYRRFVKDAFIGLVAIKALGGTFTAIEPDFSFMEKKPPKF